MGTDLIGVNTPDLLQNHLVSGTNNFYIEARLNIQYVQLSGVFKTNRPNISRKFAKILRIFGKASSTFHTDALVVE